MNDGPGNPARRARREVRRALREGRAVADPELARAALIKSRAGLDHVTAITGRLDRPRTRFAGSALGMLALGVALLTIAVHRDSAILVAFAFIDLAFGLVFLVVPPLLRRRYRGWERNLKRAASTNEALLHDKDDREGERG